MIWPTAGTDDRPFPLPSRKASSASIVAPVCTRTDAGVPATMLIATRQFVVSSSTTLVAHDWSFVIVKGAQLCMNPRGLIVYPAA